MIELIKTQKEIEEVENRPAQLTLGFVNGLLKRLDALEHPEPLELLINYHHEKYPDLKPLEKHGNFYDLRSAVDINLKKDEHVYIPLGISLYLPDGYYAELLPRSSSFKKFGFIVANSMGIIDTEYRSLKDEWMLSVIPMRDMHINMNDRIAQFTIAKEIPFIIKEGTWEVDARGGLGHTGKD